MDSITLSKELLKKLENLKDGEEPIKKVIERLIESYEELQDYIEEKYEKQERIKISSLTVKTTLLREVSDA